MIIKLCCIITLILIIYIIPLYHGVPQKIDIDVGDIVLIDGNTFTSSMIRLISGSKFAHIGIINRIVNGEPYMLHCVTKVNNKNKSGIAEDRLFSQKILNYTSGIYIMKHRNAYNNKKYKSKNCKKYNNIIYDVFSGLNKKSNYYNCITFIQYIFAKYNIYFDNISIAFGQFNNIVYELISRNLFHQPILIYSNIPSLHFNYITKWLNL